MNRNSPFALWFMNWSPRRFTLELGNLGTVRWLSFHREQWGWSALCYTLLFWTHKKNFGWGLLDKVKKCDGKSGASLDATQTEKGHRSRGVMDHKRWRVAWKWRMVRWSCTETRKGGIQISISRRQALFFICSKSMERDGGLSGWEPGCRYHVSRHVLTCRGNITAVSKSDQHSFNTVPFFFVPKQKFEQHIFDVFRWETWSGRNEFLWISRGEERNTLYKEQRVRQRCWSNIGHVIRVAPFERWKHWFGDATFLMNHIVMAGPTKVCLGRCGVCCGFGAIFSQGSSRDVSCECRVPDTEQKKFDSLCFMMALGCVAGPSILTQTTYALFWSYASQASSGCWLGVDLVVKMWWTILGWSDTAEGAWVRWIWI